jgi:hypothetical protein
MAFHVFVEGPTDATPAGVERLANAIAQHYGLPAADLHARLQKGRFRVKGNADRETAEKYCRDLEILGARCTIEEATAQNSQRATPLPFPAVRPATPVAGSPVLPPKPAPTGRPSTPPGGFQSGLSAAFTSEAPAAANLGALEGDGLSFSLSSVDGADDRKQPSAAAFGPPGDALSASIGPAANIAPAADKPVAAGKPKDVPLDLFAPPDAEDAKLQVDLAVDDNPKSRASTPPPVADEQPPQRKSEPSLTTGRISKPALPAAPVTAKSKLGPLADPRARFAVGVLLAILLGFVPAHFVASARESSAYKAIDNKVLAAQQMADTPDAYATLDRMRADQLERKRGEQRNTAIIALAIWALVGAGIAFVWFKKVPWDRFD